MELTTKYTLEDWRRKEIEVHNIPNEVLELTFEGVLKKAFGKVGTADLNPVELVFLCVFLQNDWRVVRTPINSNRPTQQAIVTAIKRATGVSDALYGSGVPDFFLWKSTGQLRFVEIKASEESLNDNQREWVKTFDWDFYIAQLAPAPEDLSDEEIMEENRIA